MKANLNFGNSLEVLKYIYLRKDKKTKSKDVAIYFKNSSSGIRYICKRFVDLGILVSKPGPGGYFIVEERLKELSVYDVYDAMKAKSRNKILDALLKDKLSEMTLFEFVNKY